MTIIGFPEHGCSLLSRAIFGRLGIGPFLTNYIDGIQAIGG